MTGAVDSAAPREQPTTQNQCSCRFKWTKNGWVSRREWRGSKRKNGGEPIQKWQREEEEHWERENNKDGNWISFRSGRGERVGNKKKERSKHKFKSFKRKRVEMSTSFCFWRLRQEGGEGLFPMWLGDAGSPNQACMGGGDPRCLPHPSRSAGPGASIGRGCTTWTLWPWF